MGKWAPASATAVFCALAILAFRASAPGMLDDTDTRVLLATIRERQNPWSWFTGDWPLFNHFYRPISTLAFEFDNWAYGDNAAGYGWTNAGLVAICTMLLAWFVREISDRPGFTVAVTVLFTFWCVGPTYRLIDACLLLAALALLGGAIRHGRAWLAYVPVALAWLWLSYEISGVEPLYNRMIAWIPGRTASVMAVFCLAAMAAYARYERLGAARPAVKAPTALDRPATRTTVVAKPPRANWLWAAFAVVCTALALGSYEQAVMLPACLLGVAVTFRLFGYRPRWSWQAGFWGALVGYLALRSALVPSKPSGYQMQQFRDGPGVYLSLSDYIAPVGGMVPGFLTALEQGIIIFLIAAPWVFLLRLAAEVGVVYTVRLEWRLALSGYALSILAYLPMAWLKLFEHYHFWPMALRAILMVAVGAAAVQATVIAWSRPVRQAPPRRAPAPGSLPRP